MDEDQVNEQQGSTNPERQEVTFTEGSGKNESSSTGMFSAVRKRDPVNLYSFFGKQNADVNERISVLERNLNTLNQGIAFNAKNQSTNFEKSLITINTSILTLQQGLKVVSDKLDLSDQLRKIRDANDKRREEQLAQQQLREGKESLVEKKMQTALAAPLQKIGAKAQSVLGGLVKFFNTILLGIIGTRGIKVLSALISGNKEKLEEIKGKILKELGVATGIFLAINGGLAIALRSVIRLTAFIGRVAFTNLLARPIRRIFDLASQNAFVRGTRAGNRSLPVPPNRNNVRNRNNVKPRLSNAFGGFGQPASIFAGIFSAMNRADQGAGAGEIAFAGGSTFALTSLFLKFASRANPYVQIGGLILAGMGADAITDRIFSGNELSNVQSQVQDRQLQLRNNSNVVVVDSEEDETNINGGAGGGVSDASALMVVPSGNTDNPYLMNSYMQYNVVM